MCVVGAFKLLDKISMIVKAASYLDFRNWEIGFYQQGSCALQFFMIDILDRCATILPLKKSSEISLTDTGKRGDLSHVEFFV